MQTKRTHAGFTLIEIMIVVTIIGILAAIAYPSYTEQIARARRADAKTALLERAQWMERQYTVSNSYARKADGTTINDAALPPLDSRTAANYTLSFATATAASAPSTNQYSLRMAPQGGMTNDKCGSFLITNTGQKTITGTTGGASRATCWDR